MVRSIIPTESDSRPSSVRSFTGVSSPSPPTSYRSIDSTTSSSSNNNNNNNNNINTKKKPGLADDLRDRTDSTVPIGEDLRDRTDGTIRATSSSESAAASAAASDKQQQQQDRGREKEVVKEVEKEKEKGGEDPIADVIRTDSSNSPPDIKTQKHDDYYEVEPSPPIDRQFSTPAAAKGTASITYSTKYANSAEMVDLPTAMPSLKQQQQQQEDPVGAAAANIAIRTTEEDSNNSSPDVKTQEHDDYYEVEPSPAIDRRFSSPPAKGTTSVTYSTKFVKDPNYDDNNNNYNNNNNDDNANPVVTTQQTTTRLAVVDLPATIPPQSLAAAAAATKPSTSAGLVVVTTTIPDGRDHTYETLPLEDSSPESKSTPESKRSNSSSGLYTTPSSGSGGSSGIHRLGSEAPRSPDPAGKKTTPSPPPTTFFTSSSALSQPKDDNNNNDNKTKTGTDTGDPEGGIVRKSSIEGPIDDNESYDEYTVTELKLNLDSTGRSWLDSTGGRLSSTGSGDGDGNEYYNEVGQLVSPQHASSVIAGDVSPYSTSGGGGGRGGGGSYDVSEGDSSYVAPMKGGGGGGGGGGNQDPSNNPIYSEMSDISNTQYASAGGAGDPDGTLPPDGDENYSTRGESIAPTPDDDDDDNNTLDSYEILNNSDRGGNYGNGNNDSSGENNQDSGRNDNAFNNGGRGESSESLTPNNGSSDIEEQRRQQQTLQATATGASSSSLNKPKTTYSKCPTIPLLILIGILTVLVFGGLVGVLTWYLWDKQVLQPLTPPTPVPGGGGMTPSPTITMVPTVTMPPNLSPSVQQQAEDAELLLLFSTIPGIGSSVFSSTTAGLAASWMLYEDPSRNNNNNSNYIQRSDDGWIQRYLLVYLYYSTTNNRSTTWLSCNPSVVVDEPSRKDEVDSTDNDSDVCRFTYPTELPGGKIIYDLVPSYRWLSGADECQWGGVACGKTVTVVDSGEPTTTSRLAVTSIVLADQYLQGSIVTEITELPQLELLDLSHNGLTGRLTEEFRSLKTLRLQYNAMTGNIPLNFFDSESIMTELNIGSNSMRGILPNDIGFASQMESLYVFDNKLTGTIPAFGNMPLRTFQGHMNQFNGPLPFDLDYGGIWPDTIRVWWSYQNQITGSIPNNINFLSDLEDLRIQDNKLTGTIPETISDLSNLFRFEVQSNFLSGSVPEEIGSIPQLRDVKVQFNSFTGVIPASLCFLESMEILVADCLLPADDGSVTSFLATTTECYCCTSCCDPVTEECVTY